MNGIKRFTYLRTLDLVGGRRQTRTTRVKGRRGRKRIKRERIRKEEGKNYFEEEVNIGFKRFMNVRSTR